ncbi:hypothetical protein [Gemmobacter denitrificans]|uniref:ABC-2 type transport system permease protein n=1 Tax=Gemmobacter denitrificans TaxID=3123040 RepID=A0ABU8BUJ7_9RHOB
MNWTIDKTISITLAVWTVAAGLLGVAFQTFGAVAWHWLAFILWLGLALVALLMQADTERRTYLSATLRHRRYTQVYLYLARPLNTWLWHRLGRMEPGPDGTLRPPPETAPLRRLMRMALTWRVLNFALLLAVAYPVLALLRPWLFGGDAVLGAGIVVFPASPFWPDRAVVLGQLVILTSGFLGRHLARSNARRFWRNAADWLPMFALASAFAFAYTFAAEYAFAGGYAVAFAFAFSYAFTGAYAFGYAVVIAGAFALAGAFSGEGAGALALVFAFAFTLTLGFLWETSRPGGAVIYLLFWWSLGLAILVRFVDASALTTGRKAMIVFLAVLPLINGLFDALSYAATLATMRKGLATRWALLLGLLDLGIGALLFAGLGATMLAVIAALNALANAPLVDLPALFAGLRASPGDYWWLYMILFSTLVPTALHLLLAALALQGLLPQGPRRRIARWIDASPHSPLDAVRGFMAQATLWWLPILLLAGAAWALWQGIGGFAARVGLGYLALLETFAIWVGAV